MAVIIEMEHVILYFKVSIVDIAVTASTYLVSR